MKTIDRALHPTLATCRRFAAVFALVTATLTAIWFGILVLIVVEVGLITPPVGMNLFIINAMDRQTKMVETYKAVLYFVSSDLIRVVILVLFPAITLFLLPL